MLEALKKWFARKGKTEERWVDIQQWADTRQYVWRDVRGNHGFVIDGRHGTLPWRMEWGPSQREYVKGNELRLRAEVAVPPELQALVLNRRLQERMESEVFDHFVEDLQTRVDTRTPPEMRWLVMYTPLTGHELKELRDRWAAVSNVKQWVEAWVAGSLGTDLQALQVEPTHPVVLMLARSRLTLRVALQAPSVAELEPWVRLFESCVREARRVGSTGCGSQEDVTEPGMFTPSLIASDHTASAH
jgi:hypothetical protein